MKLEDIIEKNIGVVTLAPKFYAEGIHCGIRKKKKDLGLIYSEEICNSAAVYTQNSIKGAPLLVTKEHLLDGKAQAVIVNSGVANTGTGKSGLDDAKRMAELTGKALGISPNDVLVASTGLIGVPLPMERIEKGILEICKKVKEGVGKNFAEAITTTDTFIKHATLKLSIGGKTVTICGIAKGSGMIHPNMATMLSFIVTDLNISSLMLSAALRESVQRTYNMITVDGDTSTNDMVIALANGVAGNEEITYQNKDYRNFVDALDILNTKLAKMIARDGEGATKLLEVRVQGAASEEDARLAAIAVAKSNLVKTAIFGADANWGRILCALGYSQAKVDVELLDIYLASKKGKIQILKNGTDTKISYQEACEILHDEDITIIIDLNLGQNEAVAWGCDLTFDYIKINGTLRK